MRWAMVHSSINGLFFDISNFLNLLDFSYELIGTLHQIVLIVKHPARNKVVAKFSAFVMCGATGLEMFSENFPLGYR
jgi:hypothetical protein